MANDDGSPRIYKYGDLNPGLASITQEEYDNPTGNVLSSVRELVRKHHTPDTRVGTGPYRGVVLRRNQDISNIDTSPPATWLANVFATRKGSSDTKDTIPEVLQSYQIFIPEIMTNLPKVSRYVPHSVSDPEHGKINLYPTFIAKDASLTPASEGDLVWVDYGNRQELKDPVYLGPIFIKPVGDEGPVDAETGGQANPFGPGAVIRSNPCQDKDRGTAPPGKNLEWNKWTSPTGHILSINRKRHKPETEVADNLKEHIEEYRRIFKVDKKIIWHPKKGPPKNGCSPKGYDKDGKRLSYVCGFQLQELNDGGPMPGGDINRTVNLKPPALNPKHPGNIKGLANSNYISSSVHHPPGSHYRGYAIDIPCATTGPVGDLIAEFWEAKGYGVIWRARGHFHHVHAGWGRAEKRKGGRGQRRIQGPYSGERIHASVRLHCLEDESQNVPATDPAAPVPATDPAAPVPDDSGNTPTSKPKIRRVPIKFDAVRYGKYKGKGLRKSLLRKDVAADASKVRDILNNLGGVLAVRAVDSGLNSTSLQHADRASAQNTLTSLHIPAMAFDIFAEAGSLWHKSNPKTCEYVITKSRETNSAGQYFFDIWAKSDKVNAEYKGYKVEKVTLMALQCPRRHRGTAQQVSITGYYINLTKILSDHGFNRVTAPSHFYKYCSGTVSKWWHMQSHRGLVNGQTKWGDTIKKVFPDSEVEASSTYKYKNYVFRGKGFRK